YLEVADAASAKAAAEDIGYPVALKARAADWRRRPDLMGVRLDLSSAEAVGDAYADVSTLSGSRVVQVQKMAHKGINCVIAVQDDPSFGSVISFGLAGVMSTLLGDRAYRVLPVTEGEARELVDAPKAAPLLSGYGFGVPVDKDALVDMVHRVSALIDDIPEVRELVCEPILSSSEGVAVLEAQVRIGPEPRPVDLG